MDYPLLIEERVSNKTFQEKAIPGDIIEAIKAYHDKNCLRLIPDIKTELIITGSDVKEALEKAAGYNAVSYVSEGTAHEFLTWRRSLYQMAQLLFKKK